MPKFLFLEDEKGLPLLYNVDQILMVSEISDDRCVVTFARDVVHQLHGEAAVYGLLADLVSEARSVNGMPPAELLKRLKRPIDSTSNNKVIPFDGSEPES